MVTTQNPASKYYHVGGSLPPNAPSYVKRKADDDLYNRLKAGEYCYVLNSPVQRLSEFIKDVILEDVAKNIVIFFDEIDSVLKLNFSSDDFFALIRFCYNQRAENPEYRRLTFVLLGVATPSDLIQNKEYTPFNIGMAIQLNGFEVLEALPLAKGLEGKVSNPQAVLEQVLRWTGGQPFLTQKLCDLILKLPEPIPAINEAKWIDQLV
jgi:hypothetical protein